MGNTFTRNRNNREDSGDASSQNAYRYPPKTGSYFGTHFIMGGERFESPQPGEYLFGDSEELNFLGNKPVPFPYPVPSGNDPTKTLKSLVYIRKDSLRLVKAPMTDKMPLEGCTGNPYNVEFIIDTDVRCAVRIHYFAEEDVINGQVIYRSRSSSETYHYKRGAGQNFNQPSHTIDPSKYADEEWQYSFDKDVYPIAIHCVVEEEEHAGHAHITYAVLEKSAEGSYTMKPLKQKQVVDGLCYLLQEIYGIENKNMERIKDVDPDDEVEDSGAECVICMSDMRDTLILPCRHLCLCSSCADSLRYQASMCPICRVKFRALLQIRAMRKKVVPTSTNSPQSDTEENPVNQEGVPQGYEAISLIEALNGQVVPPISNEGVHLQISSPLTVGLYCVEKKGQKETKVLVSGPIEYQKEMDTDKESSKGTLEKKKDKDKVVDTTDVTSTEATSDATPDEVVPRPIIKEIVPSPLKSTVVTVRCSPDGSIKTETKISPVREAELIPPQITRTLHDRSYKTNINLTRLTCGLSTGDMADDEREDSSEPEPDYDDRDSDDLAITPTTSNQDLYSGISASVSFSELPPASLQYESDCSVKYNSHDVSSLTDTHHSGTDGSSFGSNSSGHALLSPDEQKHASDDIKSGEEDEEVHE
ncbi:probable E3 ubiquitin-protein ligase MGRN1 isoform X2 [Physella acuta]|uniref:probable E3 ubiquitin-protein ligase MGRN1 isoform X2 n=1 Tax=Physella acuta TaxID=109671 RepID=UPI0027DD0261|nr:probable E3 ubiquitin-protein ligase MGRN1 isoform X2 [Physella acuta]